MRGWVLNDSREVIGSIGITSSGAILRQKMTRLHRERAAKGGDCADD